MGRLPGRHVGDLSTGSRLDGAAALLSECCVQGVAGPVARSFGSLFRLSPQVLWGNDPEGRGYTGRWGAHVAQDPQTRRSGMAFPRFWQLFFETLVRNDLPAVTIALKTGEATTWTVPHDWNAKNNTVECIGAGVGLES